MSFMPLWPNLQPRATDPLWFNADKPIDDESEVTALELERQAWVNYEKTIINIIVFNSLLSIKYFMLQS